MATFHGHKGGLSRWDGMRWLVIQTSLNENDDHLPLDESIDEQG